MPNRTEFSRSEDAHQNNTSEKKRNFLQRVFGSRSAESGAPEKPEKGRPSMEDIKKTIDKLWITPEQIKKTREMLKKLHYPVSTDSSTYDENLQQALIQFQDKIWSSHPSILDVAVTKDGVTTLVENGYVQQASYGILGRGLYSVLSEMAEAKGGLDELKQELVQTAIDKNTSLAASIWEEEQGKIYETLWVSQSTWFGSRAFVDIVQRFQRDNGLEADGWIAKDGPTWQKIFQTTWETPPAEWEKPQAKQKDDTQKPAEAQQKPPVRTETPGEEKPQPPTTPDKVHEAEENEKKILTELHKLDWFQKATLADIGLTQYDHHLPDSSPLKWHDEDAQDDWWLVMWDGFTVKNGKIYTPDGHEVNQKGEKIKKDTPSEGNDKWKDLSPDFRKLVENKDGKIPEPINIQELNDNAASSHKTLIKQLGDADIHYIQACTNIRRILFYWDATWLQKIDFSKLTHLNIVSANISAPGINIGKNSRNNIHVVTGDKYQKIDFDADKSYIYQDRKLTEVWALSDAERVWSEDPEVITVGMKILESLRTNPALKDIKTLKEIWISYSDSKWWEFPAGIAWSDPSDEGNHSVKIAPGYKVENGKIVPPSSWDKPWSSETQANKDKVKEKELQIINSLHAIPWLEKVTLEDVGIHYNYDTNHCVLPKGLRFKTEDDDYSVILREGFKVENGKIVDEKTKNPEKVERISAKFLNGISDKAELQKAIPELFHDGDLIDGEVKDANYRLVKKEGDTVYVEFDNNKNGLPDGYDIIQNGKIIQGGSDMFSNSSYSRLERLFANPENALVMTDEDRRILKEKYSLYDDSSKFDFNFYSGNPVVEKVINFSEVRSSLKSILVHMDRLSDTTNEPDDVKRNMEGLHQTLQEYENSAYKWMITENMYSQMADFKNYTVSTKDFKKPSTLAELLKRANELQKSVPTDITNVSDL